MKTCYLSFCLIAGSMFLSACGGSGSSDSGNLAQPVIPASEETGLDSRPFNPTCIAHDRPPIEASVAVKSVVSLWSEPAELKASIAMVQAPGSMSRWFVLTRSGVVTEYSNGGTFSKVGTFLNIADRITKTYFGQPAEFGALGIAFHPDFQVNSQVFIFYTAEVGLSYVARLSRFTSTDGGNTLDPSSEEILISLNLTVPSHVGGNLAFGPDGFLYLGTGDNGSILASQDLDSLKGKILRLDVDAGMPYGIPADNPWIAGGGRPEIYALGFRNPWRWSFDRATGELWVGDVGGKLWEEIDRVNKAGNYGWPIKEGNHCRVSDPCDTTNIIDPVVEYSHEGGSAAVVGGFVYRGSSIPNLQGTYLYMDLISGQLWALFYDEQGAPQPTIILEAGEGYVSMAEGNDGELYLLRFASIDRLVPQGVVPPDTFPKKLSETGCVDSVDPTRPAQGLIPYDINIPLWSDGAIKERWMALPDGNFIHIDADGDWQFPIGSVLIKNFRLADKLIETRLFIYHYDGEWGGYSYEWNDDQTDAILLPAGKSKMVNGQVWKFPSRSQCMQCHTIAAGRTLGPETIQLNGEFIYPSTGVKANQLTSLSHIELFDAPLSDSVDNLPRLPRTTDETTSLESRARGYLHANCSMCHRPGGPGLGPEDFRYEIPTMGMGAVNMLPTQGYLGVADARLLSPGDPEKSIISLRIKASGLGRMPPLGTEIIDQQNSTLIDQWIESGLGQSVPVQ